MTDFVKYLYTGSYVDEQQHLVIVYSTSVYGVQSGAYTFFTAETPEIYLEDFPVEPDGTLRYYSHTVEGEYLTLDLAFGEEYWLPLDTLQAAFGWEAYLDTEGNLLMIVTDPSNVTDLVRWLPSWN